MTAGGASSSDGIDLRIRKTKQYEFLGILTTNKEHNKVITVGIERVQRHPRERHGRQNGIRMHWFYSDSPTAKHVSRSDPISYPLLMSDLPGQLDTVEGRFLYLHRHRKPAIDRFVLHVWLIANS
jgi:hypothetical protein